MINHWKRYHCEFTINSLSVINAFFQALNNQSINACKLKELTLDLHHQVSIEWCDLVQCTALKSLSILYPREFFIHLAEGLMMNLKD